MIDGTHLYTIIIGRDRLSPEIVFSKTKLYALNNNVVWEALMKEDILKELEELSEQIHETWRHL